MGTRLAGSRAPVVAAGATATHPTMIKVRRRPSRRGMASATRRTGGNMRGGFPGRHLAIVATLATGGRATMIKVRG